MLTGSALTGGGFREPTGGGGNVEAISEFCPQDVLLTGIQDTAFSTAK